MLETCQHGFIAEHTLTVRDSNNSNGNGVSTSGINSTVLVNDTSTLSMNTNANNDTQKTVTDTSKQLIQHPHWQCNLSPVIQHLHWHPIKNKHKTQRLLQD